MVEILREYEQGEMKIVEYTRDGITVSHTVKTPISQETEPEKPQETLEEKIDRFEQQIEEDNIIKFEVLATIYEGILLGGN